MNHFGTENHGVLVAVERVAIVVDGEDLILDFHGVAFDKTVGTIALTTPSYPRGLNSAKKVRYSGRPS